MSTALLSICFFETKKSGISQLVKIPDIWQFAMTICTAMHSIPPPSTMSTTYHAMLQPVEEKKGQENMKLRRSYFFKEFLFSVILRFKALLKDFLSYMA